MKRTLSPWWKKALRRPLRGRPPAERWRPRLEALEGRVLLSGDTLLTATPLAFNTFGAAQATRFLSDPREVDLYRVRLGAGDRVSAAVSAAASGGSLQSLLRAFDAAGRPLALDDQEGGDPRLTFQAATAGVYYVGVSAAPDDNYDPQVARSGRPGGTTGLYTLSLRDAPAALRSDVTGSSFRLGAGTAAWGDTVAVSFTLENRGGGPASPTARVQLLLSDKNTFDASSHLYEFPQSFSLAGFGAGRPFPVGALAVTLPGPAAAQALGLPPSGAVFLGVRVTGDPTQDAGNSDKVPVHRGEDWEALTVVTPAGAGAADLSQVDSGLNVRARDALAGPGDTRLYGFTVTDGQGPGRLTAQVTAAGGSLAPRLTLSAPGGQVLVQSDDGSVVQHLLPGAYTLTVSARSGGGSYQLVTEFVQASPPLGPPKVGWAPHAVTTADLNNDGIPDLALANRGGGTVSVLLGNGDGTFRPQKPYPVGQRPTSVVAADLNGDGRPDLAVTNYDESTVSVLLGDGDGSFQPAPSLPVAQGPYGLAVADVSGDGVPDLVVASYYGNPSGGTVSVLLGDGDGSFPVQNTFPVGQKASSVAVADLNGDGAPDLAVTDYGDDMVGVLLGDGHGSFADQTTYTVDQGAYAVVTADLNGDGSPDLAVANRGAGTVDVLLGDGDGSFRGPTSIPVGQQPSSVAAVDLNGDGRPDLVAANYFDDTVSVLLGDGGGTFRPQQTFPAGFGSAAAAVADVNGDGRPDLVVANLGEGTVSVLPGNGDGSFEAPGDVRVGRGPGGVAAADINGDGHLDVVTANTGEGTVGVLLGNGDGSFQEQTSYALGGGPRSVAAADVNGDGRPDLVAANYYDGTVSVLLGNGDGSFRPQQTLPVGKAPASVAVADVNGDRRPDLVVADHDDRAVGVLLGNGDGSFRAEKTFPVSGRPNTVAVADVNGDGRPDLVSVDFAYDKNKSPATVGVLLGNGDGSFRAERTFTVGRGPNGVAVADVNGDGRPDLIVANRYPYSDPAEGSVSVLLGDGDGTFRAEKPIPVGANPRAVAVADVNGDGRPDLVVANFGDPSLGVLLGNGDGTFQGQTLIPSGRGPGAVAAADVNGDGRPDLVAANGGEGTVSVLLGDGGSFLPAGRDAGTGPRNTPFLADIAVPGVLDSVVLDGSGNILFRKGLLGAGQQYAPPVAVNATVPDPKTGKPEALPARDLAVLHAGGRWAVATADALPDPAILTAQGRYAYTVSVYTYANGSLTRRGGAPAFYTPRLPTRITAGDLTGDGLDDLVVLDALDDSVQVAFQRPDGTFEPPLTLPVGVSPSDVALRDVNGDGLPDLVVADQGSGEVTVLLNDAAHSFTAVERFRAGPGPYGLQAGARNLNLASLNQPVSLAAGDFTAHGRIDLLVVDRETGDLHVLRGDSAGGFDDPQAPLTVSAGSPGPGGLPGPAVAADFHGIDGLDSRRAARQDLAVLMQGLGEVWIYTNNGDGTFTHNPAADVQVGAGATGLAVVAGSGPGVFNLLVGNRFGDVLVIHGRGDGTFRPFTRLDQAVPFVTLDHDGRQDVILANQATDEALTLTRQAGSKNFTAGALAPKGSLIGPGALTVADLNGDGRPDLVVANSDSNTVLVYVGQAGGAFAATPLSFFAGTNPVAVTVRDLNGDGILDLAVANKGSDDVSILFGSRTLQPGGAVRDWGLIPGPRLKAGASPLGVTFEDVTGDGTPDLVVTDAAPGAGGFVRVLPGIGTGGVGTGFFQDNNPIIVPLPGTPLGPLVPFGLADSPTRPGFVATTAGVVSINLDLLTAGLAFASDRLSALGVGAGGQVVAGFNDGSVGLLTPTGTGALAEALIFRDAGLTDPSALQEVTSDGVPEIYATTAGEDRVFVFALSDGVPVVEVTPPPVVEGPRIDIVPGVQSGGGEPVGVVSLLPLVTAEAGAEGPTAGPPVPIRLSDGVAGLLSTLLVGTSGGEGKEAADQGAAVVLPPGGGFPPAFGVGEGEGGDQVVARGTHSLLDVYITGFDDALDAIRQQLRQQQEANEVEGRDAAEGPRRPAPAPPGRQDVLDGIFGAWAGPEEAAAGRQVVGAPEVSSQTAADTLPQGRQETAGNGRESRDEPPCDAVGGPWDGVQVRPAASQPLPHLETCLGLAGASLRQAAGAQRPEPASVGPALPGEVTRAKWEDDTGALFLSLLLTGAWLWADDCLPGEGKQPGGPPGSRPRPSTRPA